MYWFPKTTIGKLSLWLVFLGVVTIILLNVIGDLAFCGKCPDGYRKEGEVCNPECYYSTPPCLAPSVPASCNRELVASTVWRTLDIILGLAAMISILFGGVLSLLALFKKKDRAILLYLPLLIGVLGLVFIVGEFVFPH
jgi:hypothetical protein